MAKYIKQEVPDMQGTGKSRVSYRLKRERHYTGEEFMTHVRRANPHLSAEVKSAVDLLAAQLAGLMAQGHSVTIDGLGTFSAAIGVRREAEVDTFVEGEPRRNAQSLRVKGINFRPARELLSATDAACTLVRGGTRRVRRLTSTPDERLQMARDYLRQHPTMSVREYSHLTGLSHTAASMELRSFRTTPASGITTIGLGSHKLYVATPEM